MPSGYAILVLHDKSFFDGSAAGDRRRFARSSRLPRAPEIDPRRGRAARERARRLRELPAPAVGGRAAGLGARRLGHARRPDLPQRGAARVSDGPRVRGLDRGAARCLAGARRVVRVRDREGRRLRGRRLPGGGCGRVGRAGRRDDLGSRCISARQRTGHGPPAGQGSQRARADRAGRGSRALRGRPRAGTGLHRAARRLVRPNPRRAGGRAEVGRDDPRPVRHARGRARRGPARADRRQPSALPPDRDDGRGSAGAAARADAAGLGPRRGSMRSSSG